MTDTLTRADLAEAVNKEVGLSQRDAAGLVDLMLEVVTESLESGQDVKISRFGTFATRQKSARMGRNPKTKVPAEISARRVVTFKPSLILKSAINA